MFAPLLRKFRQLTTDPVLRCWLMGRVLGRWPGEPEFEAHRPSYLRRHLPYTCEVAAGAFDLRDVSSPKTLLQMQLAGIDLHLKPGDVLDVFERPFDDIEAHLSLHRFAWLAAHGEDVDPGWVDAIWVKWAEIYGVVDDSWVWHPYTASERAINILTFARTYGWSGNQAAFRDLLALHAENITRKLEYFGDHHTSNHLANNGRGLYLLGLWMEMEKARDIGLTILLEEAQRIFMASGLLREGSSHYHLLLAKNYKDVSVAAKQAGRPEHQQLGKIADAALARVGVLRLPGGLPLIGDISPDLAPDHVLKHMPAVSGKLAEFTVVDGWARLNLGPWSGLWHVAPEGWSQMPGHGHQDLGGFELHFQDEPVFIDLGRGAYGEQGEAARYRSAVMHNGITLDDQDPYPPNRPYYDDVFRQHAGGPKPVISHENSTVSLDFTSGGKSHHNRSWRFDHDEMMLSDKISGSGSHKITRRLHTCLSPKVIDGGILLSGKHTYQLQCTDGQIKINPATRWRAYGRGVPAYQIEISQVAQLPYSSELNVEVINNAG